MIFITLAKQKG